MCERISGCFYYAINVVQYEMELHVLHIVEGSSMYAFSMVTL